MKIEVTKEFVGKTIFAIPTGNNARRGKERQDIEEFEVISFARKYMTVKRVNGYQETSMCPKQAQHKKQFAQDIQVMQVIFSLLQKMMLKIFNWRLNFEVKLIGFCLILIRLLN